eukprot:9280999-Heterocapsa_arctica.AAC.1
MDTNESKAKQARTILVDRMKKVQACKHEEKSIQQKLRNMKKVVVKKELKKKHTGTTSHALHTDLET